MGADCGHVCCHEVTKWLLFSVWQAVDRLPWERLLTPGLSGGSGRGSAPTAAYSASSVLAAVVTADATNAGEPVFGGCRGAARCWLPVQRRVPSSRGGGSSTCARACIKS
ncbi:hypothetical protein GCM10010298_76420 [Streptomyces microflavus]|uniref:Uncharacterized protein n=1 Tax=Streptomyces microflavus TaxID=1919 RepID=A0A7J0D621_STRMI|nr:hypothetical protein Smic_87370 [Streptomyces microflavus]GGY00033.1 hypothetical protein GCM10010298_76420 [Streptomyces microflavus]